MHLFISHATKDSGREALALAEALEAQGHVCWIAPRDVRPGIPYPRQIVEALEQCSGLVLLLSPAANDSADVLQEVQLAAQAKKTIAPVVLNGASPGADLRYYVSVRHQIAWSGADATARRLVQTFPSPPRGGEGQGEGAAPREPTAPELRLSPPRTPTAPPGTDATAVCRWYITFQRCAAKLTRTVRRSDCPAIASAQRRRASPLYGREREVVCDWHRRDGVGRADRGACMATLAPTPPSIDA